MEIWLGDQHTLDEHLAAMVERMRGGAFDEHDLSASLLNVQGDIGFIDIQGSLGNSWFGTSYTAVRNAVIEAANNPDVSQIVLNIDSPGGTVSGMFDTARLISYVNQTIKPITAHSSGTMTSAAYALGSSAGQVYASDSAKVGSIGVMAVHMDISKRMEDLGVKPTVLFSGEQKALGSEYVPLTDQAREVMQGHMDKLYGLFIDHVAATRNKTPDYVRNTMAEGKIFLGKDAQASGLIDGVLGLDDLVQRLALQTSQKEKTVAKRLPAHTVAAIAAGIPVDAAVALQDSHLDAPALDATASDTSTDPVDPQAAPPAPAPSPAPVQDVAVANSLQTLLETKLVELAEAKAENTRLKTENTQYQATETSLREVVQTRMNHLEVALRCAPTDKGILAGLPTSVLLAQHAALQTRLEQTYPVGGISRPASVEQDDTKVSKIDPTLLNAVSF